MSSPHAAWVAANLAEPEIAPFSTEDLAELSRYLTPRALAAGEVLFNESEHPSGVWILQSGAIELIWGTGPDRALVRLIYPGEAVGDLQILRRVPSPFKARAAERSECLFIAEGDFNRLIATCPPVARRWVAKLALQVSKNHERIVGLLTSELRSRLARFLLYESVEGAFRHSQGTIAEMLGVHRSSINQILGEFDGLGLVKVAYRCIEVRDPAGLRSMAEGRTPPAE